MVAQRRLSIDLEILQIFFAVWCIGSYLFITNLLEILDYFHIFILPYRSSVMINFNRQWKQFVERTSHWNAKRRCNELKRLIAVALTSQWRHSDPNRQNDCLCNRLFRLKIKMHQTLIIAFCEAHSLIVGVFFLTWVCNAGNFSILWRDWWYWNDTTYIDTLQEIMMGYLFILLHFFYFGKYQMNMLGKPF